MIRSLTRDDVPAAAALLVARHEQHRLASPLLRPLDQAAAEEEIARLLETGDGAVAVAGGEVVGYLIGTPRDAASWGASTWVEPAGCAGEHLPELWASLAAVWVADGRPAQYALVPPSLASAFFDLGFGLQQVHAAKVPAAAASDDRVRRAERSDVPVLARLDLILDEHMRGSPVFSSLAPTPYEAALADWESDFDDDAYTAFVAEVDGQVVGSAIGCDVAKSSSNTGLIVPERAALLGFAAVLPSARGLGLGRALGSAVEGWARAAGYPVLCTDWRGTNLQAARTWPSLGYAPTFLRLHRLIGH